MTAVLRQRVVEARLVITNKKVSRNRKVERDIRIQDYDVSDLISEITCGDIFKIKGFRPLRVTSIITKPVKDIRGDYSLAIVTLNCEVGD